MRIKKLLNVILLFLVIGVLSNLTLASTPVVEATTYTILDNGNWSFDYVGTDTTSYYAELAGYKGDAFIDKLSEIISANTIRFSYGGSGTKECLKETDEDPRNSNNVILLYSGDSISKSGGWNQEHTWAKSHGFPESTSKSTKPYSDLHHLRPTYNNINSMRSNYDFGEVEDFSGEVKNAGYGNYYIPNLLFEPRDAVKGDVARIMMYMDVRYAGQSYNDNINLTLNNKVPSPKPNTGNGEFGHLDTLLKWHSEDPVDDFERLRNDRIHELQGNRNPFIDHPEYVVEVYDSEYNGVTPEPPTDEERANVVISAINAIGTVSLDSKTKIEKAESLYNALNATQKELVTNYNTLLTARETYIYILANTPVATSYEANFNDISTTFSYSANKTVTLADEDWLFSYGYSSNNDIRLGNNSSATLPTKFQSLFSSTAGASLEMLFDIPNSSYIKFNFSGSYGTISEIAIVASYDGGITYELVSTVSSYVSSIEANISPQGNTRFALIIRGSTPRLKLTDVRIETSNINNNVTKLIDDIDSIEEIVINNEMLILLNSIQAIYDSLSNEDKEKVTNYNDLITIKNEFDSLLTNTVNQFDERILNIHTSFTTNIFNEEIYIEIEEFLDDYLNLEALVSDLLSGSELAEDVFDIYFEVLDYLDLVEIVLEDLNDDSKELYLEFYNKTFIKEYIDNNPTYYQLTLEMYDIPYIQEFEQLNTKSSLSFEYTYDGNQYALVEDSLKIRFGATIEKTLYDELKSLGTSVVFGIKIDNDSFIPLDTAFVVKEGDLVEDANGNYCQFSLVLENMTLEEINEVHTYQIYIQIDDEYYYMKSTTKSFVNVAEAYVLSNDPTIEKYLGVLEYIVSLKK